MPFFFSALFDDTEDPITDTRACHELPGTIRLGMEDEDTEPCEDTDGCFGAIEEERVCKEDAGSMREQAFESRYCACFFLC